MPESFLFQTEALKALFTALHEQGYEIIGPTIQAEAIVYAPLETPDQLPIGWTDEQDGGRYRLKRRDDAAYFGYAVGPYSWKQFLFPPRERLWSAHKTSTGLKTTAATPEASKRAFLGVRACELAAIRIQDRVFLEGEVVDPGYHARRQDNIIIAVQCAVAGDTCFCVSMDTGPRARQDYDLALTEVINENGHFFRVEVGSDQGREILKAVPHEALDSQREAQAESVIDTTSQEMGRRMPTVDLKALLYRNCEHPRWDEVAERCLTCANCTLVCPTCFCSTVEDTTDLTGEHAERWRQWDSCFTMDFSYLHGGSVRTSSRSRYRQWMTHKLATWFDQFGSSGCVGCGRCITWCPVGIDITEEVAAIHATDEESS